MLTSAAILLVLVGLMHSVLGGRRLIAPLLARADLPIILGSLKNTRLTLFVGWHMLSVVFFAQAVVVLVMAYAPEQLVAAVLLTLSAATGGAGLMALVLTAGRHRSWLMFLPISALTALAVFL